MDEAGVGDADLADAMGALGDLPVEGDLHALERYLVALCEVDQHGADARAQGGHEKLGG